MGIIEYKNNGDELLRQRAQEQLYHAIEWFSKYTNLNPKTRIIDGTQYPELRRIR
ncbi:MAG: hypothetical protein Q7R52_04820 [archaeon]|nr:hypothetical protein [archaeon]